MAEEVSQMPRKLTTMDEHAMPIPDVAPAVDPDEPVMLRVPIGHRPEGPRVTIPRLDPPAEAREQGERQAEPVHDAGEATTATKWPAPHEDPPGAARGDAPAAEGERPRSWPAPREELEELVLQGLTNREIGERYGVSAVTVQARLQQLGIRRDPETRAKLLSRGGRKGRQAGWKQNPLFKPKPAEAAPDEPPDTAEDKAPQDTAAQAGDRDPLDEFGAYVARVIREARKMGLPVDVEIRLRVGGAA